MLGKTSQGRLIKIRLDIQSNRPYNLKYVLQGTDGCYESIRFHDEKDRVWIKGIHEEEKMGYLDELEEKYMPDLWRENSKELEKQLHGGSDYLIMLDYIEALTNGRKMPIGIHEAMDMTIPGLISQDSIARGGEWLTVPDSREW